MKNPLDFRNSTVLVLFVLYSVVSLSQNNATPIDSALIACYDFSGNANDNSGNGNNGTVNGATLVSDRNGNINSAYSFSGSNQNIIIPGFSSQVPGNNFSISFWATSNLAATRSAFLMSPDDPSNRLNIHIYYVGSIYWDFGNISSNGRLYSGSGALPPTNTWDHWVFVVSNSNGGFMKCYRNGTLLASQSGNSSYSNAQLKNLLIGGGVGTGNSYLWFDGKLDDIKIYKRVLIQNDVTTLYTTTTTCFQCATVAPPVNITPPGLLNICSGQSANLFATSSNSITWYSSVNMNSPIGTGATLTTATLSAGNYTFCAIASSSCASSTTTSFVVTVSPTPTLSIIGAGNVCSGTAVSVFANSNGNGTIYWSASPLLNPVAGTGNNFVTPPLPAGSYNYYAITDAPCASGNPVSTVINVNPTPVLSIAVSSPEICFGQSATLNVSGAYTYYWSNGSNGASVVVSPTATSVYTVTGNANGCSSAVSVSVTVSKCTGVMDQASALGRIKIYPNPAKGEFTIYHDFSVDVVSVEIVNALGEVLGKTDLHEKQTSIDLPNKIKGVYLVRIFTNSSYIGYSKLIID